MTICFGLGPILTATSDNSSGDNSSGMHPALSPDQIRALLKWHIDAGADVALSPTPVNHFEAFKNNEAVAKARTQAATKAPLQDHPALQHQAKAPPPQNRGRPAAPAIPSEQEARENARSIAARSKTLDELRAAIEQFQGSALRNTAKNTVFSDGNPNAKIMLVGETPVRDEDIEGKPFVGESGKLLDKMLAAIGLDRTQVYLTSILPWRPPGNRKATPSEAKVCLPFIYRHIELVNPEILILVGAIPSQNILGTTTTMSALRGRWKTHTSNGKEIPTLPMFHPEFLLRQPAQKKAAWMDLLSIKSKLEDLDV
jgi:uracil-DNA glycosylase family 4